MLRRRNKFSVFSEYVFKLIVIFLSSRGLLFDQSVWITELRKIIFFIFVYVKKKQAFKFYVRMHGAKLGGFIKISKFNNMLHAAFLNLSYPPPSQWIQ